MPCKSTLRCAVVALSLVLGVGLIAVGAGAASSPITARHSVHPLREKVPPGYVRVSKNFDASAGGQTDGQVSCPSGTVVWGGGVFIDDPSNLDLTINDSIPDADGGGWQVTVNNATETETDSEIFALCADQPASYSIEDTGAAENPGGSDTLATTSCPAGSVVLGGGGYTSEPSTSVSLNSSWPTSSKRIDSWDVYVNNRSVLQEVIVAYAVCGKKPKGYRMVIGTTADNLTGQDTGAVTTCGAAVPISGGVYTTSADLNVNVHSTYPAGIEWNSDENNGSESDEMMTPFAVCAK